MWRRNEFGRDLERDDVLVDLDPCRRLDCPDEHPVLRLGRRERAEVVLARQQGGRGSERVEVERARMPQRPARLERRALAAPPHAVAIRARPGVEPRVEAVGGRLGGDHRDVVRERCVERLGGPARAAARPPPRPRRRSPARARPCRCGRRPRTPPRGRTATRAPSAARPRPSARPAGARSRGSRVPS